MHSKLVLVNLCSLHFRHCWEQQPDLLWLHRKGTIILLSHLINLVTMEIHFMLSVFLMTLLSVLQLKELLNYYYPIEIDSSRPVEEKIPLMVEWCVTTVMVLSPLCHSGLFINYGLSVTGGPKPTSFWWSRRLKKTCWQLLWGSLKSCSGQKVHWLWRFQQI